jgi:hypothetical protein
MDQEPFFDRTFICGGPKVKGTYSMQQDRTMGRTQIVFAALPSGIAFFSLDAKRTGGPAARFNKVIHADLTRRMDRVDQAQIALLPGTVGSSVTITDDALPLDADSGQT